MPPMAPVAAHTRGYQGFAPAAGALINCSPRRQSGQRGLHALALADQSQQQRDGQLSRQDTWREKITAGYWETEVEAETGSENKRLTRKGRKCIFAVTGLVLLVMVIVAIVVGIVTTRENKHDSSPGGPLKKPQTVEEPPKLPEGAHVIKLQGVPEKSDSCVSPPSLWSCDLPDGSPFPTDVSPSDHSAPPEFHFTINIQKGTDPSTGPKYDISLVAQNPRSPDQDLSQILDNAPSSVLSRTPETNKPRRKRGLRFKRQDSPAPAKSPAPGTLKDQLLQFFYSGMATEHYEFQMRYTKTIRIPPSSNAEQGTYEWEGTRFKVIIWTRKLSDGGVELADSQASGDFPYAVSIVQDRDENGGLIKYDSNPSKTIQEKSGEAERCRCEWKNWRAKG